MATVIAVFAVVIAVWLAVVGLISLVFSWAWNAVVPSAFNGPELSFPQSFAIVVVLSIIGSLLFKRG